VEDEHADRVYVPGSNTTPPPARDVEPFWPPEELDAPVHGGRPVRHEPGPALPLQSSVPTPPVPPQPPRQSAFPDHPPLSAQPPFPTAAADPGSAEPPPGNGQPAVYRAADRPADRVPVAPPQVTPAPAPTPPVTAPPTQAWPNIGSPAASNGSDESGPAPMSPADGPEPAAADSPWSQPPQQRPAPGPSPAELYDDVEIQPLGNRDRMASGQYPVTRSTPAPRAEATPRPSTSADPSANRPAWARPDAPAADRHQPELYRPEQRVPQQPAPQQPAPQQPAPEQPAPEQSPPHQRTSAPVPSPELLPVTERAAYYPTVTPRRPPQQSEGEPAPGPVPVEQPPQPQPPWDRRAQSAPPAVGPYPPAVDPRTVPPHVAQHPQVAQPVPRTPVQSHPQAEAKGRTNNNNGEQARPQQPPRMPPQQAHDPYHQEPWVSDGSAPTAEEFARRRLARPAEPVATMGPRALLQKGTLGLVKLAPGRREQEYKQDVEMVRRNFGGLRQVTVVNPKGGAGKTVAVLLLAMTFGQKRGGYVLAWDNNETQGTLGMRAQQDFHARTVRDMMRDLDLFRGSQGRVGDLSQYVRAQGEGMFDVLASDESATAGEMLTANAFGEIREIVSRFYKLIFVDTGNNVRAQNWQAAMDATDQLVITMSARNDSAETAARMLDHLEQSGRQRLVRQAISVVSMPPTRKDIDLPAIERHFAARTRAVLISPYEKLIDSGEPLRYAQLSSDTRNAWLKIAAAVAEGL
jgi:MinD-like ATPase involved in chromosome partitioning or flagellar assembly